MSQYKPVINSYLRCIENKDFIYSFYDRFLASGTEIKNKFTHVDFDKQTKLLRHGLMSVITYLDQKSLAGRYMFEKLRETHGTLGMNILPEHYEIWKKSMIETIRTVDPEFSDSLEQQWNHVLDVAIRLIQHEDEALN